jgi:hypothetical protein
MYSRQAGQHVGAVHGKPRGGVWFAVHDKSWGETMLNKRRRNLAEANIS